MGVCPLPYIYNPHSDTCIRLTESPASWETANDTCRSAGEYLVTFATAASSQWFRAKVAELLSENAGRTPVEIVLSPLKQDNFMNKN